MTNTNNTTLYTGVTSEPVERVWKHKNKIHPGSFTARYNLHKLVYYEFHDHIADAIAREKQIKAGSRKKKEVLINAFNPGWNDFYEKLKEEIEMNAKKQVRKKITA